MNPCEPQPMTPAGAAHGIVMLAACAGVGLLVDLFTGSGLAGALATGAAMVAYLWEVSRQSPECKAWLAAQRERPAWLDALGDPAPT